MKILVIELTEDADLNLIPVGTALTITDDADPPATFTGTVLACMVAVDPPSLEGDYHLAPIIKPADPPQPAQ